MRIRRGDKIADESSVIMVKVQCSDLHRDKKKVLKDIVAILGQILKEYEEK